MYKVLPYSSTKFANWLVAVILVGVPFHAFLTVWASTWVGHYTLLRLWDEILLAILVVIVTAWLVRDRQVRRQLISSLLFRLIVAYVVLTLALGMVALTKGEVAPKALGYALIVNLQFLIWLVVVWLVASRSPWLSTHWRKLFFWPLAIVAAFALLQFLVLPNDFLAHFGYNKDATVAPFTTINQNTNTIRAQSTLRGPNPLGAYLALGLGLISTVITWGRKNWWAVTLAMLSVMALFLSFSRSAWVGAFVAAILISWWRLRRVKSRRLLIAVVGIVVIVVAGSLAIFRQSSGVQDALLHEHAGSTAKQTSNEGHVSAFRSGLSDLVHEPFGRGTGTAGPASWYNVDHAVRNSESYFLEIGQELGWAGLLLFIAINVVIASQLWRRRGVALALGLLASLIGLTIVNQFAYAWSDDALAYLWWGLAGLALASPAVPKVRALAR